MLARNPSSQVTSLAKLHSQHLHMDFWGYEMQCALLKSPYPGAHERGLYFASGLND